MDVSAFVRMGELSRFLLYPVQMSLRKLSAFFFPSSAADDADSALEGGSLPLLPPPLLEGPFLRGRNVSITSLEGVSGGAELYVEKKDHSALFTDCAHTAQNLARTQTCCQ